jgi:hypothetical protein
MSEKVLDEYVAGIMKKIYATAPEEMLWYCYAIPESKPRRNSKQ